MLREFYQEEFEYIIKDILNNDEFLKTQDKVHHGITRYEHLMRVSYYSFLITKFLRLNYIETTKAALLHDFFLEETKGESKIKALYKHPIYAFENAKKYYNLTPLQEDIIKTHMFPITFTPPKYLESWVVDIIDDIASIYERGNNIRKHCKTAMIFLYVLLFINVK